MANDTESIILTISADVRQMQRAMARLQTDTQAKLKGVENSFGGVDRAARRTAVAVQTTQDTISRSMRATNQQAANLSFQLNDIGQGLLAGTSPFTIMIQQGGQVAQVMNQIRASGAGMGAAIVGAFGSMINPVTLLSFALIAAAGYAVQYFTAVNDGSDEAKKVFEDETKLLEQLASKWGDLVPAIKEAADQRRKALEQGELKQGAEIAIAATYEKLGPVLDGIIAGLQDVKAEAARTVAQTDDQKAALQELTDAEDGYNQAREKHLLTGAEIERLEVAIGAVVDATSDKYADYMDMLAKARTFFAKQAADDAKIRRDSLKASDEALAKQKAFNKAMEDLGKAAEPTMTKVQQLWKSYADAIANATTELQRHQAAQALTEGLTNLGTETDLANVKSAADLIKKEEGFITHAKWDVNAFRVGFGSDTFVDEMGKVQKVTKDTVVTMDQANADLARRLGEFQNTIKGQIGSGTFEALAEEQKAALTSIAYNYGSLPDSIVKAIKGGDTGQVQRAIADLSANPARRRREAELFGSASPTGGGALDIKDQADAQKEKNAALAEEAKIKGEIGKGFDAVAAKEAEALKRDELMRDAKKAAAAEDRQLTAQEIADINAQAEAYGKLQGQIEGAKQAKTFEGRVTALDAETEAMRLQAEQAGITAQATDQKRVADEAEIEVLKIKNALLAQGITLTDAQNAALLQSVTANINAKVALEEHKQTLKDITASQEEFAQQMGGILKGAIGGFISDMRAGKSAGEAFSNMIDKVIDGLINMALEAAFSADNMKGLFSGGGGGGGGGGFLSSLFGNLFGGGGTAAVAEKGGLVGDPNMPTRRANPRDFIGAKSYLRGGFPGQPPGSIPIYAHPGEMILPKSMVRGGAAMGGRETNISNQLGPVTVDMAGTGTVAAGTQQAKQFGENVRALIAQEMVRESRPGGLLRPGGSMRP